MLLAGGGVAERTVLFCTSSQPILGSWYVCVLAISTQCRLLHGWVTEEGGSLWRMGGCSNPSKHQSLNMFNTHWGYRPVIGPSSRTALPCCYSPLPSVNRALVCEALVRAASTWGEQCACANAGEEVLRTQLEVDLRITYYQSGNSSVGRSSE